MFLSNLYKEYEAMHNNEDFSGDELRKLRRNRSEGYRDDGKPPLTESEAAKFIANTVRQMEHKYKYKRKQLRRISAAVELARQDVETVLRRYEPTTPVTGYRNTLGDWVS